jgi:hypothetical protein
MPEVMQPMTPPPQPEAAGPLLVIYEPEDTRIGGYPSPQDYVSFMPGCMPEPAIQQPTPIAAPSKFWPNLNVNLNVLEWMGKNAAQQAPMYHHHPAPAFHYQAPMFFRY